MEKIDDLVFTAVMTLASRTLILRDRLLGREKRAKREDSGRLKISRLSISSGKELLDAVFVARPASLHTQHSCSVTASGRP